MPAPRRLTPRTLLALSAAGLLALLSGCNRGAAPDTATVAAEAPQVDDLGYMAATPIGHAPSGYPWIANLKCVDLDQDGLEDIVFCEAKENKVIWLRQLPGGKFEEHVLADDLRAPVHVQPVMGFSHPGRIDLLVASMGEVFPNNDKIGTIYILENDGHEHFIKHMIIDHVARVTDVQAGDFNEDGQLDLAVGQFGYDQGEIRWMERTGPWSFKSHNLLNLSGTINVCVADFTGHGHQDIAALVSQEWEEVFLFTNDGHGNFTSKVIFGSTNEDFASSNLSLCDLNQDGRPDLLYSNGDGFGPSPVPGPRPWHGVQWLENLGNGNFRFHRIGYLAGAYSPIAVDLDGDGKIDVVAVSAFNEWEKPTATSMVWFRNDGNEHFTPHVLAYNPTHLLTVDAGTFDKSGLPSLVTGAFFGNPPYDRISRILLWRHTGAKPVPDRPSPAP